MARADASVITTTRGVPWWGAVLIGLVPTLIGMGVDLGTGSASDAAVGWTTGIAAVLGCVVATLAVRRRSIFTPMVQPPLIIAASVVICFAIFSSSSILTLSVFLVDSFPAMLTATGASLILGMVRYIAQPLHGTRSR